MLLNTEQNTILPSYNDNIEATVDACTLDPHSPLPSPRPCRSRCCRRWALSRASSSRPRWRRRSTAAPAASRPGLPCASPPSPVCDVTTKRHQPIFMNSEQYSVISSRYMTLAHDVSSGGLECCNGYAYGELRPFIVKFFNLGLDVVTGVVTTLNHLTALLAYAVNARLVSRHFRQQRLVLLHQVLNANQIATCNAISTITVTTR